jgi:hypothetical protein
MPQQGIESDHFRVKKNMPKVGRFRSFNSARKSIAGFEAMLWFRKGFGLTGQWSLREQNDLLTMLFGIEKLTKPENRSQNGRNLFVSERCDRPLPLRRRLEGFLEPLVGRRSFF